MSNFAFTPKTTAPTFGTGTASAPAFGTVSPFGSAPNFGTTTAAAPTFGTPPAAAAPPTFGTPTFGTSNATQPTFGSATTSTAPTFGTPAQATAVAAFGTPSTTTPAFGATAPPSFGNVATTTAGTLGFASQPTFGAPTAQPAFSLATTAAPAFGGTTTSLLGAATTTTTAALGGTGGFNFGTTTSTANTTAAPLSFGTGATAITTNAALPTLGLGGGTSLTFGKAPTTTTTGLPAFGQPGSGFFSKPITSAAAPASTTNTIPTSTAFVGLGGIDVSATQFKTGDSKQDNVKVKETQVPDEIAKTVDILKTYIKTQKALSSDIGRTSSSKLINVSNEIATLRFSLQDIANSVETNYNQIKLLRKETTKAIQSVEMAQRTRDTPPGIQFENIAPFQYFQNLVAKYEHDLNNFRQQIETTERHMHALANPQTVSPEDLKRCFQQINESFISLAGRLHEIHQNVELQKEQYLSLRKYRLRDTTNVFAELEQDKNVIAAGNPLLPLGPTPFSTISALNSLNKTFNPPNVGSAK